MESLDRARHQHLSRRLLEELEQQFAAADDIRALREKRPEAVGRSMMPPLALLDSRLENAVYQSLRRPLDSQATSETRPLAREMRRRGTLLGHAGRLVAAIGVSAIIAQLFVIMMPAARQPDNTQVFAADVQSFATALSRQHRSEAPPRPALAAFQSLLASDDTAQADEREQPEKQSDRVLRRFLQWRQKANPREAAR
jgi:hypothetical protein